MRSTYRLQHELSLRQRLDSLQREIGDDSEGWGQKVATRNRQVANRLREELADTRGDLEWVIDGRGVYGHHITMARFFSFIDPLVQSLRWLGRDILFLEGRPASDAATIGELVDPTFAGSFHGSFGIRISPPPIGEQLTLDGSVFDRTADRLVTIFEAARSDDPEPAILQSVAGLRQRTLTGLQRLSQAVSDSGSPAVIRWRGERTVTIQRHHADALAATVALAEVTEVERPVVGILEGADLESGAFHLMIRESTGRESHYRGRSEPEAASQLRGLALGTQVSAVLVVIETDSPILESPKENYVLRSIISRTPPELSD